MNIGYIIKSERLRNKLSQEEVAKAIGSTKQAVYKYEMGIVTNIPMDKISKMATLFGVTPAYLMGWEEESVNEFPQRLKELREEHNWSIRQLARLTDISHSAVSSYESGTRKPKREALKAFANVFNVDISYLVGESDIRCAHPVDLQLFGNSVQLDETQAKLVTLYNKIADKEGFIRFTERLSALSEEQQRFVFENLLQGR